VAAALTHAVAVGRSPRQTAREIREALGGDLNRALTIARTEHLRAYRGASLRSYQENADILRGWQWRASPSRRTCPVCLAMDGTEHPLDEAFGSHVNCRCTPIPLLRDRPTPARETGEEWFARQPAAVQREMLGPGKYALYQQGQIGLADLVGVTHDPQWGTVRYQRSIRELRAKPPEAS
jgi:SPP1 gp7 family putative phage head morphogenesis protein